MDDRTARAHATARRWDDGGRQPRSQAGGAAVTSIELPAPSLFDRLYAAAAPLLFQALHVGARVFGADGDGLRQRAGIMPPCGEPCVWLHGASAGEMAAAANLVGLLRAGGLRFAAAYTTTNEAGMRLIARRLAPGDVSALAPWDAPRWVGRACDAWRPAALLLIETELWPALIRTAAERGIAVVCASARIYPCDLPRYRWIRRLLRPTFQRVSAVLAQSDAERDRFVALGAPALRCAVAGNLKHAGVPPDAAESEAFRRAIGIGPAERLWIAGSLHADEIDLFWAAYDRLPEHLRRVIAAPRHAAALEAIEAGARARGVAVTRRSAGASGAWRLLLLDGMGELRTAYACAALAVVGGSFAPHGGHDLVEPLRCGTPVLFGPHCAHIEPEASALRRAEPSAVVSTPADLADRIAAWMNDETMRRGIWARQQAVLPDPGAIGERYRAALEPWLRVCRPTASAGPFS